MMKFFGKVLVSVWLVMAILGVQGLASAAEPEGPIEMLAPCSPGGAADRLARVMEKVFLAEKMLKQPFVITYKPGGGGAVAWAALIGFKGDMTKLSVFPPAILTNELLGASPLKFEDMTPLATLTGEDAAFAVNPKGKIKSAEDLVKALKTHPEEVRFGTAIAIGNQWHIAFAMLADALGADILKVRATAFNSGSKARTALLGNHLDVCVSGFKTFAKFHQSGHLRVVAKAGEKRSGGIAANVPTWRELGYDVVLAATRGILGPPGLSKDQIQYWENLLGETVKKPLWEKQMEQQFLTTKFLDHKGTLAMLAKDRERYKKTLIRIGLIK